MGWWPWRRGGDGDGNVDTGWDGDEFYYRVILYPTITLDETYFLARIRLTAYGLRNIDLDIFISAMEVLSLPLFFC